VAHVGKLYPVAFRRDLNLNTATNTRYLGRSLALVISDVGGSWGSAVNNATILDCHEMRPPVGGIQSWETGVRLIAGRLINISAKVQLEANYDWTILAQISDGTLGNLGRSIVRFRDANRYDRFATNFNIEFPPHPAVFNFTAVQSQIAWRQLNWTEYNILHP